MKKLILCSFLVFSGMCFAQESLIPNKMETDSIYNSNIVDKVPEYPGGINEFYAFLAKEYITPDTKGESGKVYTTFIIEKDGSVGDIKILRDFGFGTGEEAIRVLKKCQNWIPAEQNGKKVRVQFALPISVKPSKKYADGKVYKAEELNVMPSFPGGMNEFYRFIGKNFRVPEDDNFEGGKVYVTFVIEDDGSVSDIKVLKDVGFETGKEAIRVLSLCPKWKPGEKNGEKVRVLYSLPITMHKTEVRNIYNSLNR